MSKKPTSENGYDLTSVKLPRLSGFSLSFLTWLMESPLSSLVQSSLLEKSGIARFGKQQFDDLPTFIPSYSAPAGKTEKATPLDKIPAQNTGMKKSGFRFNSITDYARAYREGNVTPLEIAEKFLDAAVDSDKGEKLLNAFIAIHREDILEQAEAATERYGKRKPLSLLDGVPIPIKDQFKVKSYPTTIGTDFMGKIPADEDSEAVARLRALGAIPAGKANMHELGLGVTGICPHHGVTRNPYDPARHTGGSSSGPATAVAAGLAPAALGADGGGSIRIPASFCGLVGLKPTYGRVSLRGDSQLCRSIEYVGPLAATVEDAAILYAAIAGPDTGDRYTLDQPPVSLENWTDTDLHGLKIGIYPEYFNHADPETVAICTGLLTKLESSGAYVREIVIPNLEAGRVAHTITVATELSQSLEKYYSEHHKHLGLDIRLNLALARKFKANDFMLAQRVRTRMMADYNRILEEVDVIVSPTTGITAPLIAEKCLPEGESDLTSLFEIMRFAAPSNMTGLPSISFPAGYTKNSLPVGMHLTGRPWDEKTLLRIAYTAELLVEKQKPQVYYDLLNLPG